MRNRVALKVIEINRLINHTIGELWINYVHVKLMLFNRNKFIISTRRSALGWC